MKLSHYPTKTDGTFVFDPTLDYDNSKPAMKPTGLWLGVDGDWKRWVDDEEMGWCDGIQEVFFELIEPHRVLILTDTEEIDQFTKEHVGTSDHYYINWGPLTDQVAGIMIAPYCWERRLHHETSWYYSWDCASACIWDLSVLREQKELTS